MCFICWLSRSYCPIFFLVQLKFLQICLTSFAFLFPCFFFAQNALRASSTFIKMLKVIWSLHQMLPVSHLVSYPESDYFLHQISRASLTHMEFIKRPIASGPLRTNHLLVLPTVYAWVLCVDFHANIQFLLSSYKFKGPHYHGFSPFNYQIA